MVLHLTVYVRNVISFFCKQKTQWNSRTFLAKNLILAYISQKIGNFGKTCNYDAFVMSYTGYLYFFWYVRKEETHSYTLVPNKHTSGVYFSSS